MQAVVLLVKGRVQAVGYRRFVKGIADELGVRGTVRNLPDGTVEIICDAEEGALTEFERRIASCAHPIRVEEVRKKEIPSEKEFGGFGIVL
ncbi:acylphosphatase [Candidatus Micrarchaeota archaeon]|nr:acylphosphatase [Candidatus Micrarchaeota archaeon]